MIDIKITRHFKSVIFSSSIGVMSSIIVATLSLYMTMSVRPLNTRIDNVEKAITNLKDLEQYLVNIKKDMIEKEQATKEIESKYAKAKELEKLTDAQFEAIKSSLRFKTWKEELWTYFIGFILGVSSSLLASAIYAKSKMRRNMEQVSTN